jgi:hypothetical protein
MEVEEAERIARQIINDFVANWTDTPTARHVERGGDHVFIFSVKPEPEIRAGRKIKMPLCLSEFQFNPLAEAMAIVLSNDRTQVDAVAMQQKSEKQVAQMMVIAPDIFGQAMWQARVIAGTLTNLPMMFQIGRFDIARGLVNSTLAMIEGKLRDGMGTIPNTRNPRITNFGLNLAIKTFIKGFEHDGSIPSQRKFARQLKVSEKAWRDFLQGEQKGRKHEDVLRGWFEQYLTITRGGDFLSRETPTGELIAQDNPN